MADDLVVEVYRASARFPGEERFGLQGQLRRAVVSTACNIVEGSARQSTSEYRHFLYVAGASASEARYLVELTSPLGLMPVSRGHALVQSYTQLIAQLQTLVRVLGTLP